MPTTRRSVLTAMAAAAGVAAATSLPATVKAASASAGRRKAPSPTGRRRILLIQGPNMGYLGKREPELYGSTTAAELDQDLRRHAQAHGYDLEIFYSNVEGFAVDKVYDAVEKGVHGIVMNPAGFTYGGYSIRDALIAVPVPYVECHMLAERDWTGSSVTIAAADGMLCGFGVHSYVLALEAMLHILRT